MRVAFDRRAQAVVGHGGQSPGRFGAGDAHGVNAEARLHLRFPAKVERGKTQFAAEVRAGHDHAFGKIMVAEQGIGRGDIALPDQRPQARAADGLAVEVDPRRAKDRQAEPASLGDQERDIAAPAPAKAPVFARASAASGANAARIPRPRCAQTPA